MGGEDGGPGAIGEDDGRERVGRGACGQREV